MDNGTAALQELLRRQQGQVPSSAGIPGGAPAANANVPSNPIATAGMAPQMPAPSGQPAVGIHPAAPTAQNPLQGAQGMIDSGKPDHISTIIKSFADILKRTQLPGEAPTLQPIQ